MKVHQRYANFSMMGGVSLISWQLPWRGTWIWIGLAAECTKYMWAVEFDLRKLVAQDAKFKIRQGKHNTATCNARATRLVRMTSLAPHLMLVMFQYSLSWSHFSDERTDNTQSVDQCNTHISTEHYQNDLESTWEYVYNKWVTTLMSSHIVERLSNGQAHD